MPVTSISVWGFSCVNSGGSRWMGIRLPVSTPAALVDRVAEQVEHAAEHALAHGHAHRPAGVGDVLPAHEPVGRAQRHAADLAAAEVLLHLAHELPLLSAETV